MHRGQPAVQAGEHVLLDIVHVHHAGRVPPRTWRRKCRASRRRSHARWRRNPTEILHVLSVGMFRAVFAGHNVLRAQVAVGHAGGRTSQSTGQESVLEIGRREGEGKTEEDTHPLHPDARQSKYSFI